MGSKGGEDQNMNTQSRIPFYVSLLVALSALFLLLYIFGRDRAKRKEKIRSIIGTYANAIVSYSEDLPGQSQALLDRFADLFVRGKYRTNLLRLLQRTGRLKPDSFRSLVRRKSLFLFIGFFASFIYSHAMTVTGILTNILFAVVAFLVPDLLVYNSVQKRGDDIQYNLPESIDMLSMCVEAGLSFQQAMAKVAASREGGIADEFSRALGEMQVGASRADAMMAMSERLNHVDVTKFVTALLQVDRLGIPISAVLKEQVKEMRMKSRERAREQAQKVPVKILGPIMVCFLPCVLIIVIGPSILNLIGSFG